MKPINLHLVNPGIAFYRLNVDLPRETTFQTSFIPLPKPLNDAQMSIFAEMGR